MEENLDKIRDGQYVHKTDKGKQQHARFFIYTERKKRRIFWIPSCRIYIDNIIFLKISNLYPLMPTITFLNKFM